MIRDKRTFIKLKFEDSFLEKKFQIYYSKKNLSIFRYSVILGAMTILLFSFVDIWALPVTFLSAIKIRFIFAIPILSFVIFLSLKENFYKYLDVALISSGLVASLIICKIIQQSKAVETGYDNYYSGILLINVWMSTFVRSRFRPALISVLLNTLSYLCVAVFFQDYLTSQNPERIMVFYTNLSFLISTSFIVVVACRDFEVYARNEFLQNIILKLDNQALIEKENKLKQQQSRMVDASRLAAVGEMAAGIAHEINNPLSIIIANVDVLNKRINEGTFDLDNIMKGLNKTDIAAKRIAKIVKSLKTYSRDGSQDELLKESLEDIVNETIYFCQEKFAHSGINFVVDEVPKCFVLCRLTQISQVLVNLLNNAYDALETTDNPKIELKFKIENKKVLISVIDNGPGIPNEIQDKIMRPFFTTKPVGKGTGLGLSLSKEIIDQHQGSLQLVSHSQGTEFVFSLPTI